MANNMSNYCQLFVIVVLVAGGSIVPVAVEGSQVCSDPLGGCGPIGECDQRCKAMHSGGQGSCQWNLCTCYYHCGPLPSPGPPDRKCTQGLGYCSAQCNYNCCNANCAMKFNQGVGFCNTIGTAHLCVCQYVCPSHLHM